MNSEAARGAGAGGGGGVGPQPQIVIHSIRGVRLCSNRDFHNQPSERFSKTKTTTSSVYQAQNGLQTGSKCVGAATGGIN